MATLIVEVDDDKLKMVKDVLKALGISIDKKSIKSAKLPNALTTRAIKDARDGKVTKAENIDELFKSA